MVLTEAIAVSQANELVNEVDMVVASTTLAVVGVSRCPFHCPFVPTSHPPPSSAICVQGHTYTKTTEAVPVISSSMNRGSGLTRRLMAKLFVLPTMSVHMDASGEPPVISATPALYVATLHTDPGSATFDEIYLIITKLKPDAWESALRGAGIWDESDDILEGLRKGFQCSLEKISLSCMSVPSNHYITRR